MQARRRRAANVMIRGNATRSTVQEAWVRWYTIDENLSERVRRMLSAARVILAVSLPKKPSANASKLLITELSQARPADSRPVTNVGCEVTGLSVGLSCRPAQAADGAGH